MLWKVHLCFLRSLVFEPRWGGKPPPDTLAPRKSRTPLDTVNSAFFAFSAVNLLLLLHGPL
jgi:hypothetical protein